MAKMGSETKTHGSPKAPNFGWPKIRRFGRFCRSFDMAEADEQFMLQAPHAQRTAALSLLAVCSLYSRSFMEGLRASLEDVQMWLATGRHE